MSLFNQGFRNPLLRFRTLLTDAPFHAASPPLSSCAHPLPCASNPSDTYRLLPPNPSTGRSPFTYLPANLPCLLLLATPSQELVLSFNRISGSGVAALASSLGDPRCRVLRLSLSRNGIGRRGGEHLGRMLRGGEAAGRWGQVREVVVGVVAAAGIAVVPVCVVVVVVVVVVASVETVTVAVGAAASRSVETHRRDPTQNTRPRPA